MALKALSSSVLVIAAAFASASAASFACGAFSEAPTTPDEAGGGDGAVDDVGAPAEGGATDGAPPDGDGDGGAATTFTLATGYQQLSGVAADDTTVYFAEQHVGKLHAVPLQGGAVRDLAGAAGAPRNLALVQSSLYWTDVGTATVNRVEAATGDGLRTTPLGPPGYDVLALAASAANVVVLGVPVPPPQGDLFQLDAALGMSTTVTGLANPWGVALVGTDVYWTASGAGRIAKGQIGSTSATVLTMTEPGCQSLAADAAGVYWARAMDVHAWIGGQVVSLSASELNPTSMATDGAAVYWMTGDGTTSIGKLRRSHRAPDAPELFAEGFTSVVDGHVSAIAFTSKYVVWITGDGRVLRREK